MMQKIVNYFGGEKRFYLILVVLFLIWLGLMILFYLKADEVTKNPCSVCAKKMNENVICSVGSQGKIINRIFYPNFTIQDLIR